MFLILGLWSLQLALWSQAPTTKTAAKRTFWMLNIWPLAFVPLSAAYNTLLWIQCALILFWRSR